MTSCKLGFLVDQHCCKIQSGLQLLKKYLEIRVLNTCAHSFVSNLGHAERSVSCICVVVALRKVRLTGVCALTEKNCDLQRK
jgi:hypothetical protein